MRRLLVLSVSHTIVLIVGFSLGIYLLPILTAPASLDAEMLEQSSADAVFSGTFVREQKGSDFLHWGEGTVSVTPSQIVHEGNLAPGPDYKLYLTTSFVEDEAEFNAVKEQAVRIGDVKTFDGFLVDIPQSVNASDYTSIVIWCEAFGEFITSAQYQ